MIRKVLAALAVMIVFAAMGGLVIPELALPSRSAFTQFFVMSSYVLLLKWTWCVVAGHRKKPEMIEAASDVVERREQSAARVFNLVDFIRRHSSVLLIVVGLLVALLIASNRYRLVTAGGKVYRLDRFSGRCEMVASGMGSPHFVPIREQGEWNGKEKREMRDTPQQNESDFDLTKWLDEQRK